MAKYIHKVKAGFGYLSQYRATRKLANYNFDLDLREIKNENQLTRSQKIQITKTFNQFKLIQHTDKMRLYKPRKQRGESESQYQKRFKKIQQKRGGSYSKLNVIPVQARKGERIKLDKDGTINIIEKRNKNGRIPAQRFNYSTDGYELDIIEDLDSYIKGVVKEHKKKHRNKPATGISANFNNYLWQENGIEDIDEFINDLQNVLNEYVTDGADSVNTVDYLTEITIISDPLFY